MSIPTTAAITRTLCAIGLRNRTTLCGGSTKLADFHVRAVVSKGERQFTRVDLCNREAEELVLRFRQLIEESTAARGYPFRVRVHEVDGVERVLSVSNR